MSSVTILYDGYSKMENGRMMANCSCTLIKGEHNIIIDTMTPSDKSKILKGLSNHNITTDDIHYVIGTHGHVDHIGNLNLFEKAKHIVGYAICDKDEFYIHPFESGEPFIINSTVKVIPTPGHTNEDISIVVTNTNGETIVVAGDIFEKLEDIENPSIWKEDAGSHDPVSQEKYRNKIILMADYIIPGHGPMFTVTEMMKSRATNFLNVT